MPRQVSWGTPSRANHLQRPRSAYALVGWALVAGTVAGALLLGLHAAGRRQALAPGPVIGAHAPLETRCEECHAATRGVIDARCQRCHDPAGAGRLTNASHVFFGSRDAEAAARAPAIPCADCHVEHRGREALLTRVGEQRCHDCHFRGLDDHPELSMLRRASIEVPGLKFSHERHVRELFEKQQMAAPATCTRCHEPRERDIAPISFERHCAQCHARSGSVGTMDPIPEGDVLSLEAIRARGVEADWTELAEGFEQRRGRISRTSLRHQDGWVLYNVRRLRARLFPDAVAAERGALQARLGQLRRRLVFATPLAGLDDAALAARETALGNELRGAQSRLAALAKAGGPADGLERIDEVLEAVRLAGGGTDPGGALRAQARALAASRPPAQALPEADWEARRAELLSALDAVRAADPALEGRAEDLRRRLLALQPGQDPEQLMRRVRDQREAELERFRDERELRAGGTTPPRAALLTRHRAVVEAAIETTQRQLDRLDVAADAVPIVDDEARQAALESVGVLGAACAKCHVIRDATLAPVVAARRILVRSRFEHAPHLLQADCARCHPSAPDSKSSDELNLRGIDACRECHGGARVSDRCRTCHDYHPPVAP